MQYKGQPIEKPKPKVIPIVREPSIGPNGEKIDNNIYFIANVVLDFENFDKLCPQPEPEYITKPNQAPIPNYNDPEYILKSEDRNQKRMDWIFLESVKETEGLGWDKVNMNDPETWSNFHTELRDAGISMIQERDLLKQVYSVSTVDNEKVEEARQSFLAIQALEEK